MPTNYSTDFYIKWRMNNYVWICVLFSVCRNGFQRSQPDCYCHLRSCLYRLFEGEVKCDLFCNIPTGPAFDDGDQPDRILVKADDRTQLGTDGFKPTHPHVLVFGEQ